MDERHPNLNEVTAMFIRTALRVLGACAIVAVTTALDCSVTNGGSADPNPTHNCEVLTTEAAFNTYSIGIDHNVGRTCPTPPNSYESLTQLLTIRRQNAARLLSTGWETTAASNALLIRDPNGYVVTQAYDPWECPSGINSNDVCTCEQVVQFTPHSAQPDPFNVADATVYYIFPTNQQSSANMRFKLVWGDET